MNKKIKIAFLIPITSKGRNWKKVEETYFNQIFIRSLIGTINSKFIYRLYLVIDSDDNLFFNENFKNFKVLNLLFGISITKIINHSVEKGHLTKLWNIAFKRAYDDGCHYFYQCGDDVQFISPNWVDESIQKLCSNNQIGLTGPLDLGRLNINKDHSPGGERFIQTQSFVSRKHMDIFGYYFPEEIRNWYCDDWITKVYYPDHFYQLKHYVVNKGGSPRYEISGTLEKNDPVKVKCNELIHQGKDKLEKFINSSAL